MNLADIIPQWWAKPAGLHSGALAGNSPHTSGRQIKALSAELKDNALGAIFEPGDITDRPPDTGIYDEIFGTLNRQDRVLARGPSMNVGAAFVQ